MRRLIAIPVAFALLLALFRDPFSHLHGSQEHHVDQPGHEHLSLIIHTHIAELSASHHHGETKIEAPHESQAPHVVSFFTVKEETPPSLLLLVEQSALFFSLVPLASIICEPSPRAHAPPQADSSIPRSPPA
jgi:hypothetical protein